MKCYNLESKKQKVKKTFGQNHSLDCLLFDLWFYIRIFLTISAFDKTILERLETKV